MKRYFSVALIIVLNFAALAQQNPVKYDVSFPNAVHHEAIVSLTVTDVTGPLKVQMSRSSPGRYATHEFGKNVYNVKAFDKSGKEITINQIQGDVYEIPKHPGHVKITYTVFGNWVDGTYLGIDETHAHINIPSMFMWVDGLSARPIEVRFNDLDTYGWKVATQLKPSAQPNVFSAPHFQYFMDSPVELSGYKETVWTDINPGGVKQSIRFSVHAPDSQTVVDKFAKMAERTVREAKAVFGELPRFDYGSYIFLNDLHPENAGDGMEHRNSTVIVSRAPKVEGFESRILGTVSHEFFHSWNVERIRPKSLEPFNFAHANMSSELWFAEGFTQYYGELILKRAGFDSLNDYCETLSGMLNTVLKAPGASNYPATRMSRNAVFTDAGVSIDQTNSVNTFTSYYYYGAVIALALDLRLRNEFNLTLDDYMKAVWKAHGKTEIPYTIPDLQKILSSLTTPQFGETFFKKYVYGTEKNNYKDLLASAGLVLRKAAAGKPSLGPLRLASENGSVRVVMNTLQGTPAYQSGIDYGDYLLKIDGNDVKTPQDLNVLLSRHKPGDEATLTFSHRGNTKTSVVRLAEDNSLEVVPAESTGVAVNARQKSLRDHWLSSKAEL